MTDSSIILFDRQRSATSLKEETLLVMIGFPPFSVLGAAVLEEAESSVALSLERDLVELELDLSTFIALMRGFGVFLLRRFLREEPGVPFPISFISFKSATNCSFSDRLANCVTALLITN